MLNTLCRITVDKIQLPKAWQYFFYSHTCNLSYFSFVCLSVAPLLSDNKHRFFIFQIHPCGVSLIMIMLWHGNIFCSSCHLWEEFVGYWIPLTMDLYDGNLMFSSWTSGPTTSVISRWWFETPWGSCDVTVMIANTQSMPHFNGWYIHWLK